jgi:hypothetical protein
MLPRKIWHPKNVVSFFSVVLENRERPPQVTRLKIVHKRAMEERITKNLYVHSNNYKQWRHVPRFQLLPPCLSCGAGAQTAGSPPRGMPSSALPSATRFGVAPFCHKVLCGTLLLQGLVWHPSATRFGVAPFCYKVWCGTFLLQGLVWHPSATRFDVAPFCYKVWCGTLLLQGLVWYPSATRFGVAPFCYKVWCGTLRLRCLVEQSSKLVWSLLLKKNSLVWHDLLQGLAFTFCYYRMVWALFCDRVFFRISPPKGTVSRNIIF